MTYFYMAALIAFAIVLGLSQLVLKKAVVTSQVGAESFWSLPFKMLGNGYFWMAVALYGALALAWVWIITKVPISKAYPFVVLSFLVVAVLEQQAFGVAFEPKFVLGAALVLGGLLLIGH
jgi:hypothetical protein